MKVTNFSLNTALITSALTIAGGLIVFIFGQLALKFIIEPLADYRKIKSQISVNLVFYANLFLNPAEFCDRNRQNERLSSDISEAQANLRKLASELTGAVQVIPIILDT